MKSTTANLVSFSCGNLTIETTISEEAVSQAIRSAAKDFYGAQEILTNIDDRHIIAYYDIPDDMPLSIARKYDPYIDNGLTLDVVYSFDRFPKRLIAKIKEYLTIIQSEIEQDQQFKHWRRHVRRIVNGTILEKSTDTVKVRLTDGSIGLMEKKDWVPKELEHYYEGSEIYFFVLKVDRDPLTIRLSRASRTIPALLMKFQIPWGSFRCTKRFIGHKCVVKTDLERTTELISAAKMVQKLLFGEVVELTKV